MGISNTSDKMSSSGNVASVLFPDFGLTVLAFGLVVLTLVWSKSKWTKPWKSGNGKMKNLPPGPRGFLAILSYFYDVLNTDFDCQVRKTAEQYGGVFGIFSKLFQGVVIQDYETLRLAFNNPAVLGRPPQKHCYLFPGNNDRGIAGTSGETWKEIRKFTISQLRNLGLGKKTLEPAIFQQVEECIAILRTRINQPFSSKHFFDLMVFNVIWEMISSEKLCSSDPQVQKLVECVSRFSESGLQGCFLARHPKLGAWFLSLFGMSNPFPDMNKQFLKFTSQFLDSRLKSIASTSPSSGEFDDFTQAALDKIKSTKDVYSPFYGQAGSGTETTGTTLSWALLFLALHPEKQEKLQREIDHILGDRPPTLHDRPSMKYTEAVINETLRKSSNLPFGVPHEAIEDTTIGPFDLPKGTAVISNLYAIHHCEETWGDPYEFRPERFLNQDESGLIKHEAFVAFGLGKRMCPGMTLAYDELFMFITRIFQEFTVTLNPEEPKPTMKFKFACSAAPFPHTLIIKERNVSQQ